MREIYLPEVNKDETNTIDYANSSGFYKKLHEFEQENKSAITVHLNTAGGDWFDGMSIYDSINYSNCPITIIGHGTVASIGTIIIQAAKKRLLMPNCTFMVHYGTCDVAGDHKMAVATMEYYKRLEERMLDIYSSKCIEGSFFIEKGFDQQKVRQFIKTKLEKLGDWYMSAQEAVDFGFADKVISKREYNNVRKTVKRDNRRA